MPRDTEPAIDEFEKPDPKILHIAIGELATEAEEVPVTFEKVSPSESKPLPSRRK